MSDIQGDCIDFVWILKIFYTTRMFTTQSSQVSLLPINSILLSQLNLSHTHFSYYLLCLWPKVKSQVLLQEYKINKAIQLLLRVVHYESH